MAFFDYIVVDRVGQRSSGQIEAETRQIAVQRLVESKQFLIEIRPAQTQGNTLTSMVARRDRLWRRPRANEVTLFIRELALLLGAGLTLNASLEALGRDTAVPRLQPLSRRLRDAIASGKSLHEAMAAEGDLFVAATIGMVSAAEATGKLHATLDRIAETREHEQKLRAKITSALVYPSLLVTTAVAVVVLLLVYVVPQFKQNLGDQALRLPASSTSVLAASDWLLQYGMAVAIGLVAMAVAVAVILRQKSMRRMLERIAFRLPVIGGLLRTALTAQFCRTLGVLLANGVGLPSSLALTRDVMHSESVRDLIDDLGRVLREGGDFTESLGRSQIFPPIVTSLLRVGSESGSLAASAERLAGMYETKLETGLQRLVALLEPTIIVLVSLFVGFIVLSIMGAIVGVYDLVGG